MKLEKWIKSLGQTIYLGSCHTVKLVKSLDHPEVTTAMNVIFVLRCMIIIAHGLEPVSADEISDISSAF